MEKIAHGAEAIVYKSQILGKNIIIKKRQYKKYRHPSLDSRIIKQRNKEEALLLKKIKSYNINTPYVYYVGTDKIIMQEIKNTNQHSKYLDKIGKEIAKLHNHNIIHGDLNLINILTSGTNVYFIDFGLGSTSSKIEDKATDLLVFKKTLLSLRKTEKYWDKILKGYAKKTNHKQIIEKIEIIENRARYL